MFTSAQVAESFSRYEEHEYRHEIVRGEIRGWEHVWFHVTGMFRHSVRGTSGNWGGEAELPIAILIEEPLWSSKVWERVR